MFQLIFYSFFLISIINLFSFERLNLPPAICKYKRLPFILSNEKNQDQLIETLLQIPQPKNGVHIGWSIEMNYKILITRKPKIAFLCDINSNVLEFYDLLKTEILQSETPHEFLQHFEIALQAHPHLLNFGKAKLRQINAILLKYGTWISIPENFFYLKQMYEKENILHLILNTSDQEDRFIIISDWLQKNNYTVDTVYTSNIEEFTQNKPVFRSNLSLLFGPNTLHIFADHTLTLKVL